jgi:hypothetical protein
MKGNDPRRALAVRSTRVGLWMLVLSAAVIAQTGCRNLGVRVYHVSGTVTFQGRPVPTGRVGFFPDATAGNRGPAGFAPIRNGAYDTRDGGRGTVGGPHCVTIWGGDGQMQVDGESLFGRPLFQEYSKVVELPQGDATVDFDVPDAPAREGRDGAVADRPAI